MDRYGSDNDYKRRKNFYASSTRRDFKSASGLASSPAGPGLSLLSQSKPPARAEKPGAGEYSSRPRFRDSASTGSAPSSGSRSNSYLKDSRYGYGNKLYSSYQSGYYHERNAERGGERNSTGAYGSFNGTKRDSDFQGYASNARDSTSRDLVNGAPRENGLFSRDTWRGERSKPSSSGTSKPFFSGRFNPNNIPVNSRSGLNGLVSSVSGDHKKERYDSYNDGSYGSRWKNSYSQRSEKGSRSSRPPQSGSRQHSAKERIRSSGLTNSLGTPKRGESYYPSKKYSGLSNRYTDRYSGKDYEYSTERNEQYSDSRTDRSMSPSTEGYRYPEDIRGDQDDSLDVSMDNYDEEVDEDRHRHEHDDDGNDDMDDEVDDDELEDDDEDDDDDEEGHEDEKVDEYDEEGNEDEEEVDVYDRNILNAENDKLHSAEPVKPHLIRAHDTQPSDAVTNVATSVPIDLNGPVDYPEGCNFPLGEIETQFLEINKEFKEASSKGEEDSFMRFSLSKPVADLSVYPFYKRNLVHFSNSFPQYLSTVRGNKEALKKKRLSLWVEYETLRKENDAKRGFLEEQLKVLHPPDDDMRRELESIDIRVKTTEPTNEVSYAHADSPPQSGRRGRRHGDLVTTEAEFQEILKSLENEQNEDPMKRAERVAATIPDLILDPVLRNGFKYMDSNNIVHDKQAWTTRVKTDFMDNFTEREHEMFCEAFCRFPKRFGQISRFMGGIRHAEECVVHYYMTKKAVNYKFLVSQFKKKNTKKVTRRKSKPKAAVQETSTDTAPSSTVENSQSLQSPPFKEAEEPQNSHVDIENKKKRRTEHGVEENDDVVKTESMESQPRKKSKSKGEEESVPFPVQPTERNPVAEMTPMTGMSAVDFIPQPEIMNPTTSVHPDVSNADQQSELVIVQGHPEEKKKHISSYWSITEVNEFPQLLKVYGSRWSCIAEKLATKTATMVRNYYQRNGNKHGWEDIVQSADHRLAQDSNTEDSKFSNVDTTIVVKPQKTSHIDIPKTEIHVYDAVDEQGRRQEVNQPPALHALPLAQIQQPAVPMGTFQHSAPFYPTRLPGLSNNSSEIKRLNVNELLSNTPNKPEPPVNQGAIRSPILAPIAPAPPPAPVHISEAPRQDVPRQEIPTEEPRKEAPRETAKSSIMNLLNSEVSAEAPVHLLPPSKPSNLAALLNAQTAPPILLPPTQGNERRGSIKSLLAD